MSTYATTTAPTFLLVHGSGTGSFIWAPLQRELALLGHRSFAVDLPGHGMEAQYPLGYQAPQDLDAWGAEKSTLADVTLDDNVEALLSNVRALRRHGPVVLAGASLGGTAITVAANREPDLIDRLVYISAWACASRPNPIAYMAEPEFAESLLPDLAGLNVGDPEAIGAGRANYRTADPRLLSGLKAAMMADVSQERFMAFLNLMQPDESLAVMTGDATIAASSWGRVPHEYIRLTQDRSLPIAMQDRLIREADELTPANPFRVHTLDTTHAGFLYRSGEVARLLAEAR